MKCKNGLKADIIKKIFDTKKLFLILLFIFVFQSWTKAYETSEDKIKIIVNVDNFPIFAKSENNWIQKKEKDEWITKKDKKKWVTKKENKEWITKKINQKNDLAYITLLPLAIIIIYIKRTFK